MELVVLGSTPARTKYFFSQIFFQVFSKNWRKKFRLQIDEICIEIVKKRKKNLNWLILKNEKGGAACIFENTTAEN